MSFRRGCAVSIFGPTLITIIVSIAFSVLVGSTNVLAEGLSHSEDDTAQRNRWTEAQSIIDAIKTDNPPDTLRLEVKLGSVQMITNTGNGTGVPSLLPAVAIGGVVSVLGNFGLEGREVYIQNLAPTAGSRNGSNCYMSWADLGPRYTFYLDTTRLDNNVVLKLLYHQNFNNFLPEVGSETLVWANYYSGLSVGFERNIPITNKLGLKGSLDLLQILQTSSPSLSPANLTRNTLADSGYGFDLQAEIYYKLQWGALPVRIGINYWQQGNETPFDDAVKQALAQNSYFQLARAFFLTTSVLF